MLFLTDKKGPRHVRIVSYRGGGLISNSLELVGEPGEEPATVDLIVDDLIAQVE
jgi:hypothetical protein